MTVFGDFFVFDSFLSDFCQFFVTFLHFDTFLSDICYIFEIPGPTLNFKKICSRLHEMPGVLRLRGARPRAELRGRRRGAGLGEDVRRQHCELVC